MGGDNGRKQREQAAEDALKKQAAEREKLAQESITKAAVVDPFVESRKSDVMTFQDWATGKAGPIDVRNRPGGAYALDLYQQARQASDAGRIGRGFNTMGGGGNPNYAAKLGAQNQLERDLAAAGALEGNVNRAIDANTAEGYNLAGITGAQNMSIANMQSGREESGSDRYLNFLQRPRQPSFMQQLALTAVGGAGQAASAYLTGGISTLGKKA